MRATAPGSAAPSRAARGREPGATTSCSSLQLEFGGDGAAQLGELDRLRRSVDFGVQPAQVEQVGGQLREPADCSLRARAVRSRASSRSRCARVEVVFDQLEHAVERGERCAQLVRGRGDERAPRRLLPAQARLHARERLRQLADLVVAVGGKRGVRALALELAGGVAQALAGGAAASS